MRRRAPVVPHVARVRNRLVAHVAVRAPAHALLALVHRANVRVEIADLRERRAAVQARVRPQLHMHGAHVLHDMMSIDRQVVAERALVAVAAAVRQDVIVDVLALLERLAAAGDGADKRPHVAMNLLIVRVEAALRREAAVALVTKVTATSAHSTFARCCRMSAVRVESSRSFLFA